MNKLLTIVTKTATICKKVVPHSRILQLIKITIKNATQTQQETFNEDYKHQTLFQANSMQPPWDVDVEWFDQEKPPAIGLTFPQLAKKATWRPSTPNHEKIS